MNEKYATLSLVQLKELAKSQGVKNVSTMRKAQLVQLMGELEEIIEKKMNLGRNRIIGKRVTSEKRRVTGKRVKSERRGVIGREVKFERRKVIGKRAKFRKKREWIIRRSLPETGLICVWTVHLNHWTAVRLPMVF